MGGARRLGNRTISHIAMKHIARLRRRTLRWFRPPVAILLRETRVAIVTQLLRDRADTFRATRFH